MTEKGLACTLVLEKPWDPRPEYLELNPAGDVPTLVISDGENSASLGDAVAIGEFLEETEPNHALLPADPFDRAETRRLVNWFERRMWAETTGYLLAEKVYKRLSGSGEPDSLMIRTACINIHPHLDYIGWLTERRNWLAGDALSLADLAAAAQLSVIDYLGAVPWDKHPEAKIWYARIKSRPSFRTLLGDHIAGLLPPRHYADLDF